jgi:phosphoglycolate phosphatase
VTSPHTISAVIVDKDGTLIDFAARWVAIGWARLDLILDRLDDVDPAGLATDLQRTWGFNPDAGYIDPRGPYAHASVEEDIAITASVLYRHGVGWNTARDLAESSFRQASAHLNRAATTVTVPGAIDALRTLRAHGLRLALVTNDTQAEADADVAALNLTDLFEVVLGQTETIASKPAPDLALTACRRLGVAPSATAAVGDTAYDAQMARAAGIGLVVAVTSGLIPAEELAPHVDVVLDSLAALPDLLAV